MGTNANARVYGRRSLLSVMLTAIAITVNHRYALGTGAFVLGAVLLAVPAALWWWFRRSQRRIALVGYLLMNAWIIVGFGLAKGLWQGALRLFLGTFLASQSTTFPKPTIGSAGFELSGLMTFIGSVFVLYYAYKLLQTVYDSERSSETMRRSAGLLATGAFVTVTSVAAVWVVSDRDRWVPPANGVVKIAIVIPTSGPYAILGNSFV